MSGSLTSLIPKFSELASDYDAVLSDVWGVIHNGIATFPHACDALMRMRARGGVVVLITNAPRPSEQVMRQLERLHVPREAYDAIVSSGDLTRATVKERHGQSPYHLGPDSKNLGAFIAWDPKSGKRVWESPEPFLAWSGALVTAGDVAFYGTLDGWFKSVDAKTGEVLSKFKVGSGVVGNPITYRGPDGKQYVAVYAGIGGDPELFSGDVVSADQSDVRPPGDFMKDIGRHTSQGGMVWLFGL